MKESEKQALITIAESEDLDFLVIILELAAKQTGVNTISEMARLNNISPNGVKSSKRYGKIYIGKQLMAVKDYIPHGLPF